VSSNLTSSAKIFNAAISIKRHLFLDNQFKGINMSQITIDHNPTPEKLKELGVSSWSIWDCAPSKFPLNFDSATESAYLLEGEIHVTPVGGETVVVKAGDFVVFHKGLQSNWEVTKQLKKHYKHS
jgi:uncharacterized protein